MANNLVQPREVSPLVLDPINKSNTVGASFGTANVDWVTPWISIQDVEHGAEELSLMAYVDWQGAASILILPQFRHFLPAKPLDPKGQVLEEEALPIEEFDGARLNATFQLEQDAITLLQANFRTDPGTQEVALAVAGIAQVRFFARAPAGSPVMRMQILAGGGWRGA